MKSDTVTVSAQLQHQSHLCNSQVLVPLLPEGTSLPIQQTKILTPQSNDHYQLQKYTSEQHGQLTDQIWSNPTSYTCTDTLGHALLLSLDTTWSIDLKLPLFHRVHIYFQRYVRTYYQTCWGARPMKLTGSRSFFSLS